MGEQLRQILARGAALPRSPVDVAALVAEARRRRRRRRLLFSGGVAFVVLVAGVTAVSWPSQVATPEIMTPADVDSEPDPEVVGSGESAVAMGGARCVVEDGPAAPSAAPVVAMVRPEGEVALFEMNGDGGALEICMALAGESALASGTSTLAPLDPVVELLVVDDYGSWRTGDRGLRYVHGRVGPGVASVTVELSDGTVVESTIEDGHFLAWWSGSVSMTVARGMDSAGEVVRERPPRGAETDESG